MDGIVIRPVVRTDLDLVASACWENRETQLRLLDEQEILGMGAWEGTKCVGQLHCYRVTLPQWDDRNFPGYGRSKPVSWPLDWPLLAAREKGLSFDKPVWAHACFHVGFAGPTARQADRSYFGRGIGRALCEASVRWAREHDYAAVLAHGGTKIAPEYNAWMGCVPWTTYAKLGFACVAQEEDGLRMPWWIQAHDARPETLKQVAEAINAGRGPNDLCAKLMLLRLQDGAPQ